MVNGTLISFEGPEGAGKSSVQLLCLLLEERNSITTREPGGVDIAERSANILDPDHSQYGCQDRVVKLILLVAGSIW